MLVYVLQTHTSHKVYDCPMCQQEFEQVSSLKDHVYLHKVNGIFTCPHCQKVSSDSVILKFSLPFQQSYISIFSPILTDISIHVFAQIALYCLQRKYFALNYFYSPILDLQRVLSHQKAHQGLPFGEKVCLHRML